MACISFLGILGIYKINVPIVVCAVVCGGVWWWFKVGVSWCLVACGRCVMVFRGVLWCVAVCRGVSWCGVVCHVFVLGGAGCGVVW